MGRSSMVNSPLRLLAGTVLAVLVVACAGAPAAPPAAAPTSPPAPKPAATTAAAATSAPAAAPQASQAALIEAAKKEGKVVEYGNQIGFEETKKALADGFRKRYGLPDSFVVQEDTILSAALQAKVQEEITANKVQADVVANDAQPWIEDLISKGEVTAYDSPEYGKYDVMVKAGLARPPYYVADPGPFVIGWNSSIIQDSNNFKSWRDLLKPEYKGKISMIDATTSSSNVMNYAAWKTVLGKDFFEKLAQQQPAFLPNVENSLNKVMSGEYPISLGVVPGRAYYFWTQRGFKDLKISFPEEGVLALPAFWAILKRAQHPNAAKLWVDFMWSKEGREIVSKMEGRIPVRDDVQSPNEVFIPPVSRIKMINFDQLKFTVQDMNAAREEWRGIFKK